MKVVAGCVLVIVVFLALVFFTEASVSKAKAEAHPQKQITFERTKFKSDCKLIRGLNTTLTGMDTCDTCQAGADEEIDIIYQRGGSACEAYTAGADWCWYNCAPCSFCVRYNRIAAYYCTE
jgi:hypothetical protein